MLTFGQLKEELRPLIFPAREAVNLVAAHDKMFVEAMVDIQRMVDCYQYNNASIFPQCATYFQCGMTVFDAPRGAIKRLWVVDKVNPTTRLEDANAPLDWCSRIDYQQKHKCDLEKYTSAVIGGCGNCGGALSSVFGFPLGLCGSKSFPTPTDAGWEGARPLPQGLHYPQTSTDSRSGRARRGVWAIERGRIYVAPWIQSTETIVVEWDGIKRTWDDSDIVEDDPTVKRAVRYYVAAGHAKDYDRDPEAFAGFRRDYDEAIRDLIWECRQETMVRGCEDSHARQNTAYAEFGPSELPDGTPTTVDNQGTCGEVRSVEFYPPTGAIVTFPTWVVLTSSSTEAEIYFTTDGSTPTKGSIRYEGPFQTVAGIVVKAIAFLGVCPSSVTSSDWRDASDYAEVPPALTVLCSNTDRCGPWFMFGPNGSPDINWQLIFALFPGAVVKSIEMYETDTEGVWNTGRSWGTQYELYPEELDGEPFRTFPLVIDDGSQLNVAYADSLGQDGAGMHYWEMFGESVGVTSTGKFYKMVLTTESGVRFYANHKISCGDDCIAISGSGALSIGDPMANGLSFTFLCASAGWMLSNYTTQGGDADDVVFQEEGIRLGQTIGPSIEFLLSVTVNGVLFRQCYITPAACSDPPPPPPTTTTTTTTTTSGCLLCECACVEGETIIASLHQQGADGNPSYSGHAVLTNVTPTGGCTFEGTISLCPDDGGDCYDVFVTIVCYSDNTWLASGVHSCGSGLCPTFSNAEGPALPDGPAGVYAMQPEYSVFTLVVT